MRCINKSSMRRVVKELQKSKNIIMKQQQNIHV